MTDYDYYLVDCSGRSGAIKVDKARVLKGEDVCSHISTEYLRRCKFTEKAYPANLHAKWSKPEWYYDHMVKCYPISSYGVIVKDHSVMREIWLSYEGEAQTQ